MTPVELDVVLVSLRDPDDPMALHEELCFQEATGVQALRIVHASDEPLGERELRADLVLFGGSGAYSVLDPHPWVKQFLVFLLEVVAEDLPAWGSCFGFQGLSLAMGGAVENRPQDTRLGGFPVQLTAAGAQDPLFAPLAPRFEAQFGHHDFVTRLPAGVTPLAQDDQGRVEAFRVDDSHFWGAQFHPELDRHTTLSRFRHYQHLYDQGEGEAIVERISRSNDHPEVPRILRRLVEIARARRLARG